MNDVRKFYWPDDPQTSRANESDKGTRRSGDAAPMQRLRIAASVFGLRVSPDTPLWIHRKLDWWDADEAAQARGATG